MQQAFLSWRRAMALCLMAVFSGSFFSTQLAEAASGGVVAQPDLLKVLKASPGRVYDASGALVPETRVRLERPWKESDICKPRIVNISQEPIRLGNIVLFDLQAHGLNTNTPIYGEGFQMLSQTEGSVGAPRDLSYKDREHYKIPEPDGLRTVYGLMTFDLGSKGHVLLGFSSCKRFVGRFSFDARQLRVSVDPENLELAPGESWDLEEFMINHGTNRHVLLDQLADRIVINHPPLPLDKVPTGWCSWYCYWDKGTQAIVHENMMAFRDKLPQIRFIQIDDGYSPTEGDWLDRNPEYGDIKASLADITKTGFSPALWVAPFIAEKKAKVLAEHPDWFVKNAAGTPLDSSTVGFGGWRHGPWFVLDGTNPDTQKYLESVFRTMRQEWGVTYFKLDANYWGAIHSGRFHDPKATRVEAYRRGMEAIIRGAGPGAVILGCNAPVWASFGVVNAMRTSNDIDRSWDSFAPTARENLNRIWLNGRQWANDPDCILLAGKDLPANVWQFHATMIHAVGGLSMSGDKAEDLTPDRLAMLKKLMTPSGRGAQFENSRYETGVKEQGKKQYYYLFNWDKQPVDRVVHLKGKSKLIDFWTGQDLGEKEGDYSVKAMPGQSAILIEGELLN